jgi:hypothetical protein
MHASARAPRLTPRSARWWLLSSLAVVACAAFAPQASPASTAPQDVTADAKTIAGFVERVNAYVALHQKLEKAAPKLPDDATPEQIHATQVALAAAITAARADAKQGDIFQPDMTAYVRRVLQQTFAGPGGRQIRASIMDENLAEATVTVNQTYPTTAPIPSMPPRVLEALPKLPEEMEYRFLADYFILLDPHAHLIVDFIPRAMPRR